MLTGWIDQDRKLAGLKALQGMTWDEGYRKGASDAEGELDAAASIGLKTAHIVRPGTFASTRHPTDTGLTHLLLEE